MPPAKLAYRSPYRSRIWLFQPARWAGRKLIIWEEINQNEASLGGSPTINVTLLFGIIYSLKLSIVLRFSGPPWFLTFSIFLRLNKPDVLLRSYLAGSRTEVKKRRKLMSLGLFHGGLAAAVSPDRKQMLGLDHPFMSPLIPGSQFSASQATLWCSSCSRFTYPRIFFGLWFIWLARAWMYNCKALHCVARFGCIQDHFISRWI